MSRGPLSPDTYIYLMGSQTMPDPTTVDLPQWNISVYQTFSYTLFSHHVLYEVVGTMQGLKLQSIKQTKRILEPRAVSTSFMGSVKIR